MNAGAVLLSASLCVAVPAAAAVSRMPQDAPAAPQPVPAPSAAPSPPDSAAGPLEGPAAEAPPEPVDPYAPLDEAERATLLRLAWHTLVGHLTNQPIQDSDLQGYSITPRLSVPRGTFVTLLKDGQLRGLQGEIEAVRPLYQQVIVFTRRAATRDARFLPLTERDLGGLVVEIALIGPRTAVSGPEEIRPDVHGVFLEKWGRRALFLPGIAARQGWSAERTLDELARQAALPPGAWKEGARIEVFTTDVLRGGPEAAAAPAEPPPAFPPAAAPAPSPAASPSPAP